MEDYMLPAKKILGIKLDKDNFILLKNHNYV